MSNQLTAKRCGTVVTNVRTDELTLGDRVLVANWNGNVSLETVTGLRLLNDTVEMDLSVTRELSCKVGTVWQRVEATS